MRHGTKTHFVRMVGTGFGACLRSLWLCCPVGSRQFTHPPDKPIEQSAIDLLDAVKDRVIGAIKSEPVALLPPAPQDIWQKRC